VSLPGSPLFLPGPGPLVLLPTWELAPSAVAPVTVDLDTQGLSRSGARALGALKVNPTLAPAGLSHTRAVGSPLVNPKLAPAGLSHTRTLGAPVISPKLGPAGLTHTRTLGSPVVGTVIAPAGLSHTRTVGSPTVNPKLAPAGLSHTRAVGNPTLGVVQQIPVVVVPGGTYGVIRAAKATPQAPAPGRSGLISGLIPALNPAGLDRSGTRALGAPTVSVAAPGVIPDVIAAGRTKGVISAVRTATKIPTGVQLPSAAILAFPDPTATLFPSGLSHTRGQGNPVVSPKVLPSGLQHTRSLGSPTVQLGAKRALGQNLTVTVAWVPRPASLIHARAQGSPTARGRITVTVDALSRTRAQGIPTLSGRVLPSGQVHTRAQGSPSVGPKTLSPASISRTRAQGNPVVTIVWIPRPASLDHTRALGSPVAHGKQTIGPASLNRTRVQGVPVLSGRATPAGIVHTRALGTIEVNLRTLAPLALDRA